MQYEALTSLPWAHGTFWVFIALVIFALIAGRKIIGAVTSMLDARAASVSAALTEAAQLKQEAEAILADAKARQVQATEDARQILASAKAEAARLAASLAADAEASAKRRERMALERIAAAEASALNEVRAVAIDVATSVSAAVLGETFGADADAAILDHAIAAVPAALRA
jgi:F-type H+-transporting ATPase subunit b